MLGHGSSSCLLRLAWSCSRANAHGGHHLGRAQPAHVAPQLVVRAVLAVRHKVHLARPLAPNWKQRLAFRLTLGGFGGRVHPSSGYKAHQAVHACLRSRRLHRCPVRLEVRPGLAQHAPLHNVERGCAGVRGVDVQVREAETRQRAKLVGRHAHGAARSRCRSGQDALLSDAVGRYQEQRRGRLGPRVHARAHRGRHVRHARLLRREAVPRVAVRRVLPARRQRGARYLACAGRRAHGARHR